MELIIVTNFWSIFFGKINSLSITEEYIFVTFKNGITKQYSFSEIIDLNASIKGLLGGELNFKTNDSSYKFPFLRKSELLAVIPTIEMLFFNVIEKNIDKSFNHFERVAINEYLRDSNIAALDDIIKNLMDSHKKLLSTSDKKLKQESFDKFEILKDHYPLEVNKEKIRSIFEQKLLLSRKSFYDKVETNPLTEQQRLAVIRNNDLNLVLAAAGTGKTSVMVGKALDLIDSKIACDTEILILAYNKAAATELNERLITRSKGCGLTVESRPSVSTFHALGRNILRECNISTYISDFAEDSLKLKLWLSGWIKSYIALDVTFLFKFIELSYQPINPFSFKNKHEYDAYVRDNEYRTLQGERVRGYQELLIANWLFINSIDYEYEKPYTSKIRVEIGFDYRPDFHIKGTDLYIEHFGVDRKGNTRPDIDAKQYNTTIKSKRELHKELGTTLLETYHYDWVEGNLQHRLEKLMLEYNVKIVKKSDEEIFKVLEESGILMNNVERYIKCLQAIRVENLDFDAILSRLNTNKIIFAQSYARLLDEIHCAYKAKLRSDNRIDFDDMIILATDLIKTGKYKPQWRHILVDEFQDISMARMELLKALINFGESPILTVVGDDWQSIYRFSGGKLELTTRFTELVGSYSLSKLEKTYRYNNSIADVAGTFVMQNPEQYKKNVTTHTKVDNSTVYLIDTKVGTNSSIEDRVLQVIEKIIANDSKGTIAVLARYRYLLDNTKERIKSLSIKSKIKYWTFHGSKGLEADYCILIGFFQGKTGFPNKNKEEIIVESLLPLLDSYEHSEERRLLYVALTRAKKKCYLLADPMAPSEFINELISPKYKLHIGSKTFEANYRKIFKCPVCSEGYFKSYQGVFGKFYKCTSGEICPSKPRVCEKCESPSIDTRTHSICNNSSCKNEMVICDRCGRPMKLRTGEYGKFWGCTGYGISDDQCKRTRKF
ncbi:MULTISPECIES: UvrD-helicase domain-containing protein [Acinetobacter]|uniref:UvrD-helicase domain-containing protein n=1 Tax=Acinetobacter TaxID=469 RepID=UPI001C4A045B|nr:UvrD-helicase domain-containing protein [Acinetobacter sp. MYb10]